MSIITKQKPKIMTLEVEPLENLEPTEINNSNPLNEDNEELPVDEVEENDDIFKRPTSKPVEKKPEKPQKEKKKLSTRKMEHMRKMREAKALKSAKKKEAQAEEILRKKKERLEKMREDVESQKPIKAELPKEIKKQLPQEVVKQVEKATQPKPRGMSNKEYMKEFFSNLNLFMESYNKLNSSKSNVQVKTSNNKKVESCTKPKEEPINVSFRTPLVSYRNVRNPFNF